MKKILGVALSIVLLVLLPQNVLASGQQIYQLQTSVTSTACSADMSFSGWDYVNVKVTSAAGSVATITLSGKTQASDTYFPYATINNPSPTGEYWSIPLTTFMQSCITSYTSGTISVVADAHKR